MPVPATVQTFVLKDGPFKCIEDVAGPPFQHDGRAGEGHGEQGEGDRNAHPPTALCHHLGKTELRFCSNQVVDALYFYVGHHRTTTNQKQDQELFHWLLFLEPEQA